MVWRRNSLLGLLGFEDVEYELANALTGWTPDVHQLVVGVDDPAGADAPESDA